MTGYAPKAGFYRSGEIGITTYSPKKAGTVIATPTTPTVTARTLDIDYTIVYNGRLFNVQNNTPGSARAVKVCYLSLDAYGHLVCTAMSAEASITPSSTNNALQVVLTNIPNGALYIAIFVDDQLAQIVPTPPASRKTSSTVASYGYHVIYEPSPRALKSQDFLDASSGLSPLACEEKTLGYTTGNLTHTINFTQIDVPVNGMPNELITTRSSQVITATFVAPITKLQALTSGGTYVEMCGDATEMTQLGFKSGSCSGNRVFGLDFPGNECYSFLNALFYGKAVHGDASQAIEYSSEAVSNMPFTLKEASSIYFSGNHSLTLLPV